MSPPVGKGYLSLPIAVKRPFIQPPWAVIEMTRENRQQGGIIAQETYIFHLHSRRKSDEEPLLLVLLSASLFHVYLYSIARPVLLECLRWRKTVCKIQCMTAYCVYHTCEPPSLPGNSKELSEPGRPQINRCEVPQPRVQVADESHPSQK